MENMYHFVAHIEHLAWWSYMLGMNAAQGKDFDFGLYDRLIPTPEDIESSVDGLMFLSDHPGACAEDMHINWCNNRIAHGWKYGPVKDEAKKEHPCLVPWDKLPLEERMKDYNFLGAAKFAIQLWEGID